MFSIFFINEKSLFLCLCYLNPLNGIQILNNTELSLSVLTDFFFKCTFFSIKQTYCKSMQTNSLGGKGIYE